MKTAELRFVWFDDRDLNTVMRAWGREHGYAGAKGGWIYHASGQSVCQGWWSLWNQSRQSVLDWLTRRNTGFDTFDELVDTHTDYRPTIQPRNAETRSLAAAYDQIQKQRGDARRAYTYYQPGRVQA